VPLDLDVERQQEVSGMRRLMMLVLSVSLLGLAGWTTPVTAQPHRRGMTAAGPCQADMEKFCKEVQPGAGRPRQCLEEHEKDLSPECQQYMQSMQNRASGHTAGRAACNAEIEKFCKDTPPVRGGIQRCLKNHQAELSDGCKAAMMGQAPRSANPTP
jgi:cysteine rich repeat protein